MLDLHAEQLVVESLGYYYSNVEKLSSEEQGAHSSTFRVKSMDTPPVSMIIKVFTKESSDEPEEQIKFEAECTRKAFRALGINEPITLEKIYTGNGTYYHYIAMPEVPGQPLKFFSKGHIDSMDQTMHVAFPLWISQIMDRLHQYNIYNLDIGPQNIFISDYSAMLIDYGLAVYFDKKSIHTCQEVKDQQTIIPTLYQYNPNAEGLNHHSDLLEFKYASIYSLFLLVLQFLGIPHPFDVDLEFTKSEFGVLLDARQQMRLAGNTIKKNLISKARFSESLGTNPTILKLMNVENSSDEFYARVERLHDLVCNFFYNYLTIFDTTKNFDRNVMIEFETEYPNAGKLMLNMLYILTNDQTLTEDSGNKEDIQVIF